ncbi:MAG: GFA family protein [Alphaproteobacteria bacterium]
MSQKQTGQCLCGAVTFALDALQRAVRICHCRQCAQWTGAQVAATRVAADQLQIMSGGAQLAWYRSSPKAERGFCATCGSSLFWRFVGGANISVMAGTLNPPTGLHVEMHIFAAERSDYCMAPDDAPRHPAFPQEN